jgi:hypothetical protein
MGHALIADLDALTDRLVAAILDEDPSYVRLGTPHEDLRRSCRDNLQRILSVLTEQAEGDVFDAPRATGSRRAQQGMPVESVLHAYSLGFRSIWDGLLVEARKSDELDVLAEAATSVWEIVDEFSTAVGDAYRDTEAEIARRDDRRREGLLDAVLEGRATDRALAADAASALDLPEHGRFVVVVLEASEQGRTSGDALAVRGLRAVWRTRSDREIGLVALGRSSVSDVCQALLVVPGARAGVSPVVEGLAEVDVALRQAETALKALAPGEPGIVELDAGLAGALLVTAPDLAARLVHRALGGVLALDPDERQLLLDTLRAWLDTGGSASQTAARLYCHRNTVLNRLRRLEGLTGRSAERVDHLVEWSLALLAMRLLPLGDATDR